MKKPETNNCPPIPFRTWPSKKAAILKAAAKANISVGEWLRQAAEAKLKEGKMKR